MKRVDIVAIIPASPIASRVARLSQERTSTVATEGSVDNASEVRCVDSELPCAVSLGKSTS